MKKLYIRVVAFVLLGVMFFGGMEIPSYASSICWIKNQVDLDLARVENAYSFVNIGFSGNDTYESVTKNLQLPKNVNGCTVTWKSDKTNVVGVDGIVYRQEETSEIVNLTAKISYNDSSLEKEFRIRVVKSMYCDYSYDDIIVLEDMMQLYFYNDIIEDLQIYTNDLGYIDFVIGSISDIKVDSYDEAFLALQGVKDLMGMDNVEDELCPENIFSDAYGYVYVFTQVYKGLPVFGSKITLSTDLEGNTTGLNSSYVPFKLNTTPSLTSDAAMSSSNLNYLIVTNTELNVYMENDTARLAWNINFVDSDGHIRNALVDANNAEVLYKRASLKTISGNTMEKMSWEKNRNLIQFMIKLSNLLCE